MSSKAVSWSPRRGARAGEQRHRVLDPRERRGTRSRSRAACGKSFSVAAVMMPSVPSRADEELLQVVAGIVLAQAAQPVPHRAVRQHHFEPERQIARVAVAQHGDAAGIGREIAADLAAALGAEAQGEEPVGLRRGALHLGEDRAGLDGDGEIRRRRARARGSCGRGSARCRARPRRGTRAAAQAGIAALRVDRHARRGAEPHDRRRLRRSRPGARTSRAAPR